MFSKYYIEDIEDNSGNQDIKSEGDPDTEDIHENVRDMTASDITILKTSEEISQCSKFWICGPKFFYLQQHANLLN